MASKKPPSPPVAVQAPIPEALGKLFELLRPIVPEVANTPKFQSDVRTQVAFAAQRLANEDPRIIASEKTIAEAKMQERVATSRDYEAAIYNLQCRLSDAENKIAQVVKEKNEGERTLDAVKMVIDYVGSRFGQRIAEAVFDEAELRYEIVRRHKDD